jgi:hypothetical protein
MDRSLTIVGLGGSIARGHDLGRVEERARCASRSGSRETTHSIVRANGNRQPNASRRSPETCGGLWRDLLGDVATYT